MRFTSFVLFATALGLGLVSLPSLAYADTLSAGTTLATPPHLFQMADGRWYDPASGLSAPTEQGVMDLLFPPLQQPQLLGATTTPPVSFDSATTTTASSGAVLDSGVSAPATTTAPLQEFPLLQAIRRGQEVLNEALVHASGTYNLKLLSEIPDWAPVQVAVWHSASDSMDIISFEKRGTEIRGDDPHIDEVNVLLSRQLQSQYQLANDQDIVVAIRYPLYHQVMVKKHKKYQREDVIYSPYSPMLGTREMVRYGNAWLDREFQKIADDLRSRGVKSKFDPSKSLADMLSSETARAILLIEHSDKTSLSQDAVSVYSKMLVTVAANGTSSYAYDDSYVGAQGFAQFMPATYSLVAKDSSLGLPTDVQEGTRQFETAVKAQLVYLDRLWSVMPDTAKALLSANPDKAAEFVVAAYNGGEGRVRKASELWGDDWSTPDTTQLKKAQTAVTNATAALKKAKKTLMAAKTNSAKKTAKAAVTKAQSALNTAQSKYDTLNAGTLRNETIDYVAKFRLALQGIRQVSTSLTGQQPSLSVASTTLTN